RIGGCENGLQRSADAIHKGIDFGGADPGPEGRSNTAENRPGRRCAIANQPTAGLPVPYALPVDDPGMQGNGTQTGRDQTRPLCRVYPDQSGATEFAQSGNSAGIKPAASMWPVPVNLNFEMGIVPRFSFFRSLCNRRLAVVTVNRTFFPIHRAVGIIKKKF